MAVTTTNLIMGPATLYIGAFGATEPADAAVNSSPAASAWTDVGGTQDGVKYTIDQTYTELEVDQIVDIPGRRLTKREAMIETNLAEPTLENMAYVLNGGTAASGSGYKSYEPAFATSATQPTYHAAILDGFAPGSYARRLILRKILSVDAVESELKKDGQTMFSVKFSCHYVTSAIAPFKIVDQTA